MRRFEYVGGGSEKFWEVDQDGMDVVVRFGRLGTNGQTQVKAFTSDGAAAAQVAKLIAEKTKKGYTEVGAPAGTLAAPAPAAVATPTPLASVSAPVAPPARPAPAPAPALAQAAPPALPDEDTWVVPSSWSRTIHPRRGGIRATSTAIDRRRAAAAAEYLIAASKVRVAKALSHAKSDPALAAEATAWFEGAQPTTTRGAGAAAALVAFATAWSADEDVAAFSDLWVADHGLPFAAQAAAEQAGMFVGNDTNTWGSHVDCYVVPGPPSSANDRGFPGQERIQRRVRAHLAAAGDDQYTAAVAALAAYQGGSTRRALALAYLVPTEVAWVDEACDAILRAGGSNDASQLLCALSSAAQLDRISGVFRPWSVMHADGALVTLAEGLGPEAAPTLASWFDHGSADADVRKRIAGILAHFPTDEAFRSLVERLDEKHVAPAVIEAMGRYPVRALRLLADAPSAAAADLFRSHVARRPDLVDAAWDGLAPAIQAKIESVRASAATIPAAPPELLPAVLATPPWTTFAGRAKPVIVNGLVATDQARLDWRAGEREAWAGHASGDPFAYRPLPWADLLAEYRAGELTDQELQFLALAPEEMARPLVPQWRPSQYFLPDPWLDVVVARFGLHFLPALVAGAKEKAQAIAPCLVPFCSPEVATAMADWLGRLKSVRPVAQAWLARHPDAAARALVPGAVGTPGKQRRDAENALRYLASTGHGATVVKAAATYGQEAAAAVEALLATDPLTVLPARIPKLPDWSDPALLDQVLLEDRAYALPPAAVAHLCTMLAMSRAGDAYAGVEVVRQACEPGSLAAFGWSLFQRWRSAGMPSKEGWAFDALGLLGDDETVRRLSPVIRAWPGEGSHARAVAGLDILASIGTDVALMHLHGIAQKAKFKGLKDRAGEKMDEVAANLGLTADQLADRLIPDLGLEEDGSLTLDFGPRQFVVGFDEQLRPFVTESGLGGPNATTGLGGPNALTGVRRKDLPKPGAKDDPELAGNAVKQYSALKKDVRTLASDQLRRLEQAMVVQRRWTAEGFEALFIRHPLLWHLVRHLVWASYDEGGTVRTSFRVAEDRTLAGLDDAELALAGDASVGVAHPLHLGTEVKAWGDVFADYEILQPFAQLGRDVHRLTAEEQSAGSLTRFRDVKVPTLKVIGLERSGWRRGRPQDGGGQNWMIRRVSDGRWVGVDLEPGIIVGMVNELPEQQLKDVWVSSRADADDWGGWQSTERFTSLDPITISEVIRDLAGITS